MRMSELKHNPSKIVLAHFKKWKKPRLGKIERLEQKLSVLPSPKQKENKPKVVVSKFVCTLESPGNFKNS